MGKGEERGGGADEGVWREGGEYASLALGGWTPLFIVMSQYTHLTDGQTDRQIELRQQYRALQSHGKRVEIYLQTTVRRDMVRYYYFWYIMETNGRHIGILLPVSILTRLPSAACEFALPYCISLKSGHIYGGVMTSY